MQMHKTPRDRNASTARRPRTTVVAVTAAAAGLTVTAFSLHVLSAPPVASVVTGGDPVTRPDNQAETAINISVIGGNRVETVTYNDETGEIPMFATYPATSRTILSGYSLLGWSTRTRTPANAEPAWTHAKLRPPAGVAALWGDPSIASNPGLPNVVLISSLMVPSSKLPPGGIVGAVTGQCSPLGGACMARSTDGGVTFSMVNCFGDTRDIMQSCMTPLETTKGHFFDGGASAVTKVGTTFVGWGAFIDTDMNRESVWKMSDAAATPAPAFVRDTGRTGTMGDTGDEGKEGDLGKIGTHERLRADGADLWKMSRDGNILKANIHGRNTPFFVVASDHQIAMDVPFPVDAAMRRVNVRTGPQFAFDIGVNEAGQREMRFIYAARDASGSFLQGGFCTIDLADCQRPAQWRMPASGVPLFFHPAIKFGVTDTTTGRGVWRVTAMSAVGGTATVVAADLVRPDQVPASPTFNGSGLVLTTLTAPQAPCPDLRIFPDGSGGTTSSGYWGDYDDMTFDPLAKSFVRAFTDSSLGCISRLQFTSTNVHVSTIETPMSTRVHLTGTIDTTDHENIGANETSLVNVDEVCVLDAAHPVDSHIDFHPCTGGEVITVLRVTCTLQANDAVEVAVHTELREGGSCDPDIELEDSEDQSKIYAVGQVQPQFAIDLTHDCFNCGDHAEIRLNAVNEGAR